MNIDVKIDAIYPSYIWKKFEIWEPQWRQYRRAVKSLVKSQKDEYTKKVKRLEDAR